MPCACAERCTGGCCCGSRRRERVAGQLTASSISGATGASCSDPSSSGSRGRRHPYSNASSNGGLAGNNTSRHSSKDTSSRRRRRAVQQWASRDAGRHVSTACTEHTHMATSSHASSSRATPIVAPSSNTCRVSTTSSRGSRCCMHHGAVCLAGVVGGDLHST